VSLWFIENLRFLLERTCVVGDILIGFLIVLGCFLEHFLERRCTVEAWSN